MEAGRDCPKSQTFLSENRESAFGLVYGYGVFQSREDFSDSLGGGLKYTIFMAVLQHLAHVVVRINDLVIHDLAILLHRHDIRIHETAIRL